MDFHLRYFIFMLSPAVFFAEPLPQPPLRQAWLFVFEAAFSDFALPRDAFRREAAAMMPPSPPLLISRFSLPAFAAITPAVSPPIYALLNDIFDCRFSRHFHITPIFSSILISLYYY